MQTGSMIRQVEEGLFELIPASGERLWVRLLDCSDRQLALDREIFKYLADKEPKLAIPRKERELPPETALFDRRVVCYWPITGEKADFFSERQQRCGAEFLAGFHLALKHFRPVNLPPGTLGSLIAHWERRLLRLAEFQRVATFRVAPGVFDRLYLDVCADVLHQAKSALKKLKESDYHFYCNDGGQICLTRYRSDRFRLVQGRLMAWEFSMCRWELPVVDLYRYLLYLCRHCGYRREMVRKALDAYETIRPLEMKERYLLQVLFGFPDRLYRIISDFFLGRSRQTVRRQLQRFYKELMQSEERMNIFN